MAMLCSCGGELVPESAATRFRRSFDIAKAVILRSGKGKPRSKKKRIQKKWLKRVDRLAAHIAFIGRPVLGPPTFTCSSCGGTRVSTLLWVGT